MASQNVHWPLSKRNVRGGAFANLFLYCLSDLQKSDIQQELQLISLDSPQQASKSIITSVELQVLQQIL